MPASKVIKDYKTLLGKMQEVAPNYIAKYIEWYMSDKDERPKWEDLVTCDPNFKYKDGTYKTEKFCLDNWLTREDSQKCIQIYMKHMKTINTMKIYQKMVEKAMQGDTNAAKWVESFHDSEFFDESTDEIDDFLNKVNIPSLAKTRG